jgi:hypothetical protein
MLTPNFQFGHFLMIQVIVIKENDKIKAPIQKEETTSSIPKRREIPKPATTVTVQIGHIF